MTAAHVDLQHTPSTCTHQDQAQCIPEFHKLLSIEGFGENVSDLVCCRDVLQLDSAVVNLLLDPVVPSCVSSMCGRWGFQQETLLTGCLPTGKSEWSGDPNFAIQVIQEHCFFPSMSHSHVLSFGTQ